MRVEKTKPESNKKEPKPCQRCLAIILIIFFLLSIAAMIFIIGSFWTVLKG